MIRVQVRPNETLETALRRFKRQCNYAGIFRLAKKYSYHEKRSDKRRREDRERIRNIQRAMRKANMKTKVRSVKRSKAKTNDEEVVDSTTITSTPVAGVVSTPPPVEQTDATTTPVAAVATPEPVAATKVETEQTEA